MKSLRLLVAAAVAVGLALPGAYASEDGSKPLVKAPTGKEWKSLFDGKSLKGWHIKHKEDKSHKVSWTALNGHLINFPPVEEDLHGIDLVSDVSLGSHELYIEFMVPKGSNSGVYVIGQYEIQVLDSYGKAKPEKTDCGGIYNIIAPSFNSSRPAGEWQSFHAVFHKAEVKDGKVAKNPRITVYHNGNKVIDNKEIEGVTGAALSNDVIEEGPLYLQGNHGTVFFKNIYYKKIDG